MLHPLISVKTININHVDSAWLINLVDEIVHKYIYRTLDFYYARICLLSTIKVGLNYGHVSKGGTIVRVIEHFPWVNTVNFCYFICFEEYLRRFSSVRTDLDHNDIVVVQFRYQFRKSAS